MERYHAMKELAPRDVVARAIDSELKRTGDDYVVLDMTHLPGDFLVERFPNIHQRCLELGIDMRTQPIPVVPAAHYCAAASSSTRTAAPACATCTPIGEVAMTGPARRQPPGVQLAARRRWSSRARAADDVRGARGRLARRTSPRGTRATRVPTDEAVVVTHNWDEIRRLMWNYVGIVRTDKRLERAAPPHRAHPRGDPRVLLELRASTATCSSCATSRSSPT